MVWDDDVPTVGGIAVVSSFLFVLMKHISTFVRYMHILYHMAIILCRHAAFM